MNSGTHRKGLGVLEMVVAAGISFMLISTIAMLFDKANSVYRLETSKGALQSELRTSLYRLTRLVKQADSIVLTRGSYTTDNTTLIIRVPSIDNTDTTIPATYDYIIYRLNPLAANELQEIIDADANSIRESNTRVLDGTLASLDFDYFDATGTALVTGSEDQAKKIRINVTTTESRAGETATVTYTEQATLRNK